jgi:1-acyl-sn-glycerol-3-phosphate acyltransferase
MHRFPLADQLPYQFFPPRAVPFWLWVGRFYWTRVLLKKQQNVVELVYQGVEHLKGVLGRGDGVLITPNHPDHADGAVMLELGHRIRQPFFYMTAYQVLLTNGRLGKALLPRIGAFPVDREGSDLKAFKTGVDVLSAGKHPLVVFPEGEVYHVSDHLTPIREGAAALAVSAAKKAAEGTKKVWIVPAALKYRFIDSYDPACEFHARMDRLESRLTWWAKSDGPILGRIRFFAEGILCLKELEYYGESRCGPLKPRIAALRDAILDDIEDRRVGKRRNDTVPVRVKELRRACLDSLAKADITPAQAYDLRRDLHDLFVVVQMFSYPGDYVFTSPTIERVAETLMKFEQDLVGYDEATPLGPRKAILRLGEPIDVTAHIASAGKRGASAALTAEMEARIQGLLDEIGPGRPLVEEGKAESRIGPRLASRLGAESPAEAARSLSEA